MKKKHRKGFAAKDPFQLRKESEEEDGGKREDFLEKMGREDLGVENPSLRVGRLKTDI